MVGPGASLRGVLAADRHDHGLWLTMMPWLAVAV
jgi:hypothetical protein